MSIKNILEELAKDIENIKKDSSKTKDPTIRIDDLIVLLQAAKVKHGNSLVAMIDPENSKFTTINALKYVDQTFYRKKNESVDVQVDNEPCVVII